MDAGTAGLTPDRETPIDSKDPAVAALAAQMFAPLIAEGAVTVDDPDPVPQPVAVQQAPAPAPAPTPAVAPEPPEPAAAAEPEPVTVEDVPTFKPRLDDDLRALLDEPDFEAEAEIEVQQELEDGDPDLDYVDPAVAAKLRALEKRNAFLEGQVVAKSKKGWVEEAKRAFPDLARLMPGEIEGINATSRRAFIREAANRNTRYQQILGPTIAKLEAAHAAVAASATQVAREEVAAAWGKPAADTLPPAAAAQQEALDRARASGDLEGAIKVLMQDKPVL